MRHFISTLSLVALLQGLPMTAIAQQNTLARTEPSSDYIQQVIDAQLMSNLPDGNFHPEQWLDRAQVATILVKTFRLDKRREAQQEKMVVVADVPPSHWAFNHIQIVLKTDIMKGYRDNMFFPNQRVTRAEGLAIFAQAYGVFQFSDGTVDELLSPYCDSKFIPRWARKAIATVIAENFINTQDGKITPLKPMRRGDMAFVLSKYLQRQKPQPETPEAPPARNPARSSEQH
ncbi:MAG: S-layer homology domain-containing protein [Richelia sp.]|nr:S-layer homology domain-containing protein [Richelia sp.]CDN17279.1 Surface layer protein precursor [Richelia intracellularis]